MFYFMGYFSSLYPPAIIKFNFVVNKISNVTILKKYPVFLVILLPTSFVLTAYKTKTEHKRYTLGSTSEKMEFKDCLRIK